MPDEPQPLQLDNVIPSEPLDEPRDLAPLHQRPTSDADVVKAMVVIRALLDAGLKSPFDFDPNKAKFLWAVRLQQFSLDILTDSVSDWLNQPGHEWPSVGDIEEIARFIIAERAREADAAKTAKICVECDDMHWVRVYDTEDGRPPADGSRGNSHLRPCPSCPEMAERSELYDRGHFTAQHIDRGGCPKCWKFIPTLAHRARAAERNRRAS